MVVLVFGATPVVAAGPVPFVVVVVVGAGSRVFTLPAAAPPSSHAKVTLDTVS